MTGMTPVIHRITSLDLRFTQQAWPFAEARRAEIDVHFAQKAREKPIWNGRILLARNAAWQEGMFALITGFLENGETPEQGIAREVLEETSLHAETVELIGVYEFIRKNELIIAYHVRASGEIALSPELLEYRLVEPAKLRPWRAGTGQALGEWMRRRGLPFEFVERPGQ